jgi:signal transduction histidine kinase
MRVSCRNLALFSASVFFLSAGVVFTMKYAIPDSIPPLYFDAEGMANRRFFLFNFYSSLGCIMWRFPLLKFFCCLFGLASAVVSGYVLNDFLTIHLCIYSAFVIIIAISFIPPFNLWIAGFSIVFFLIFLQHPSPLGLSMAGLYFENPDPSEYIILFLCLVVLGGFMCFICFLSDKYDQSQATISHLNTIGTNMLLFNHRLQEYVKNSGDEAVKRDRLRFTSDLHDSCGYVFTNIIAMADAAISYPSMEIGKAQDTFHLIQNQAREGLSRTRETLHMIRGLQDPVPESIDAIYEMKRIFHDITGIKVDIENGNMRQNYGPSVNKALIRIVQEAFTNSVRHGQSSRIIIQFWEFPRYLSMTVRDNGIGAQNIVKGIGLAGMEERLAALGGTMEVSSPEDGGFQLKVEIPCVEIPCIEGLKGGINGRIETQDTLGG